VKTTKVSRNEQPTASQNYVRKLAKALLLFPIIVFFLNGCSESESVEDGLPESASDSSYYHFLGWKDNPQHGHDFSVNPQNCKACHGEDLSGGSSGVSCADCHHNDDYPYYYHDGVAGGATHIIMGGCDGCHGNDFTGGPTGQSCSISTCHTDRDTCSNPGCHQTLQSHPVHTLASSNGPAAMACDGTCHHTNPLEYSQFADGNDLYSTTVCDDCHSPGGVYDGVSDNVIGAKPNWEDGVYNASGDALSGGKEDWCAGCHDDDPSVIETVYAPGVMGDNVNYGFKVSGHGRPDASKECLDCHNARATHIDGEARTYLFDSAYYAAAQSGVEYAAGYRLRYVGEEVPLMVPANYATTFGYNAASMRDNAFRLCFDAGCHDSIEIFDDAPGDGIDSNFKASLTGPPRNYSYAWGIGGDINEHVAHIMNFVGTLWDSDWDTDTTGAGGSDGYDSMTACSSCHNVHGAAGAEGSTNEAMIRDGSLAGRTGYGFSYVIEDPSVGGYPWVTSTDATQLTSVGAIFRNNTAKMCGGSMCHGNPAPPPASSYDATGTGWGNYLEHYRPWVDY
jgi:hypothetical protein